MRRVACGLAPAIVAAAIWAAPAWGHAFYVDPAAQPGATCQVGDPCQTIAEAMAVQDPDEGSPDIVVVEPGIYTENLALDVTPQVPFADRSLIASGVGVHVIVPAVAAQPTVEIGAAANVVGFTIRGPKPAVLNGPGRLSFNTFDSATVANGDAHVTVGTAAGGSVVDRNTFVDDGTGTQVGVASLAPGSPVIRQNDFSKLPTAIRIDAGSPTLDGDLITHGGTGISAAAGTSVTVLNLTSIGNSVADLALQDAGLTLNSSIVEDPIVAGGTSTCAISRSAGPTTGGGPCTSFQLSNAAPGFVDAAGGNYHLAAGSPLIDAGDPALLSGLDIDGNERAIDGNCDGAAVRDIGADEFERDCPPPPVVPPPVTPDPPAGDTDPPETSLNAKKVDGRTATFRFGSDEPHSSFNCRIDKKPFRACESPVRYGRIDPGRHVFRVTAVDAAGNEDPVPARQRFRIARPGRSGGARG